MIEGAEFPLNLETRLAAFSPNTALVAGFSPAVANRVAFFARRKGIPFGIWSGELSSRPTARGRVRRFQRRKLVKQARFAIAYGSRSADYLRSLNSELPVAIGRNSPILPDRSDRHEGRAVVHLLAISRAERGKALDVLMTPCTNYLRSRVNSLS